MINQSLLNTIKKQFFKYHTLSSLVIIVVLLTKCHCGNMEPTPIEPIKTPSAIYYNLETIDLDIKDQASLSFAFNGKKLMLDEKSGLYISEDLIVYRTKEGNWKATVIGPGGIESALKIKSQNNLTKEISIKTTSEIFPYKDELGPEWPGMYNIGNTCFANSLYKLLARSSIFDEVINQDKPKQIHTFLRNIINGIRLGKRSTLHEEAVNRMISKIFLDQLTLQSGAAWNDRKQNDPGKILEDIMICIFSNLIRTIPPQDVEAVIADVNANSSSGCVMAEGLLNEKGNRIIGAIYQNYCGFLQNLEPPYTETPATFTQNFGYLLTTPKQLISITTSCLEDMLETIQIPIWNYETKKQVALKTYKPVAMCIHYGALPSGHYISLISFNKAGLFEHNDRQVNKLTKLPSSGGIQVVIYEIQD